ncbi:hypothetical protein L3Q82_019590 [Scortum barcoo]|uniref:Uncharacterized protein n=1 Tax=Scortum barcoo TaxID=214431 RepID=A0ACB8VBW3_9TELE|nr:hypothetical protein L3Q82_019590 [Scortum barcoo]
MIYILQGTGNAESSESRLVYKQHRNGKMPETVKAPKKGSKKASVQSDKERQEEEENQERRVMPSTCTKS